MTDNGPESTQNTPRRSAAPRHSRRHRRQRGKNLVLFGLLVALIALFFVLTLVRMEPPVG